ncbi:MAG TPA: 30S ribosomal protein S18 [Candidatus Pacebacteria bacterium]|nr:30S ribosomal protein S18 [Candidatus Paceibacterota bacterium]
MQKPKRTGRTTTRAPKADKNLTFSYKRSGELRHFITEQGSILPRIKTGLSQKQQRRLAVAVKRARHLALLPFTQTV